MIFVILTRVTTAAPIDDQLGIKHSRFRKTGVAGMRNRYRSTRHLFRRAREINIKTPKLKVNNLIKL